MFGGSRIDRWFRRYRRTRDPRALGAVFDLAAPELLRIAAYLVRDRQAAEDIVQSAFLVAIERPQAFDETQRLMPWLCGIVVNLARAEKRRVGRPAPVAVPRGDPDPAVAADDSEFRAAFARAVDSLPQPYRPVLELHLGHGLLAVDIARVLERPAGTVRAQITRGLELLRSRLPRGFVAGFAAVVASSSALPRLRAQVLARAAELHAAAPAAAAIPLAVFGIGIMNKNLLLVAAVALSLLCTVLYLVGGGTPVTPPASADAAVAAASALPPPAHGEAAGTGEVEARVAATPVAEPGNAAPAGDGRIRIVATWRADGAPAVRQAIEAVRLDAPFADLQPRRAFTDDRGAAELDAVPGGRWTVFASTGDSAAVEVAGGATVEVAMHLAAWGIVRGTVVDARGQGVPEADVWVSSSIRYRTGAPACFGRFGSFTLRTDAAGRFATRLARGQGIAAAKRGYGPSPMLQPCVDTAPRDGIDVTLRLEDEGGTLVVDVVDAAGEPVAGAQVVAGDEIPFVIDIAKGTMTPPARRGGTDARGHVELAPLPQGEVKLQVHARGFAPWDGEETMAPSATAHRRVQLVPAATVFGIARDDAGEPVAEARITWRGAELFPGAGGIVAVADPAGRFELGGLPAGELAVAAGKDGVGQVEVRLVTAVGQRVQWDPVLTKQPAITGVVLGVDGRPAGGADVFAAQDGGRGSAIGKADADGRFALGPLAAEARYTVTAEIVHPTQGAVRVSQRDVAPGSEVTLRIGGGRERTARVVGRLLAADGSPASRVHLVATPVRDDGSREAIGSRIDAGGDGLFDSGLCVPGRLRLLVMCEGLVWLDLGTLELHDGERRDLGDLRLAAAGRLVVRIAGDAPERAEATVFRDAEELVAIACSGGEARFDALPPGEYAVRILVPGDPPRLGLVSCRVVAGEEQRAEAVLRACQRCMVAFRVDGATRRSALLSASDGDGRELLRVRLELAAGDPARNLPLPIGTRRLTCRTEDGLCGEAAVALPATAPIELRLAR